MASLFLIRHAEPELTGVLLGQLDPPLSPAGRLRAAATLTGIQVDVAWTSPLRRATETATFIRSNRVVEIPELREIDHGEWTGKTWAEVESRWADLALCKANDWLGIAAPGGEQWADFLDRVRKAWRVVRAGPEPMAVVAHQGVNAALRYLIDGSDPVQFTQGYGEVIRLEFD